jgi:T5SS/PEP-CTERM-associated repeat protein
MKMFLLSCALLVALSATTAHAVFITTGDVVYNDPSTWNRYTYAYVGDTSNGTLTVNGGSELLSAYVGIGVSSGATGTVTLDGSSSTWNNNGSLDVGVSGNGILNIINNGNVLVA